MSRVRVVRNDRAVDDLLDRDKRQHLRKRANQLSGVTKDTHRTAPRGGTNVNRFGERRSAPGEPPAMETGGLFAMIDQGVTVDRDEATVVVNFGFGPGKGSMEDGTRRMRGRPLGRISVARFLEFVRAQS